MNIALLEFLLVFLDHSAPMNAQLEQKKAGAAEALSRRGHAATTIQTLAQNGRPGLT